MTGGLRIVALGDSVSAGVGDFVARGEAPGWAGHLAHALGSSNFTNLARTGARMRDVLSEQLPAALESRAGLATLLIGGNDVLRSDFDPERIAAGARIVCSDLTGNGTPVLVVLLHEPARVLPRGGGPFGRVIAARANAVNEALVANLSSLSGVRLLDPRSNPSTHERGHWHIDRMHPSASGHRMLAGLALELAADWGFTPVRAIPGEVKESPGPVLIALWLIANGLPWFAKRSTDLIPELIRVVISESRNPAREPAQGTHSYS